MSSSQLLVCDFDGVIVDGISEYWASARSACQYLLKATNEIKELPHTAPKAFREIRPWVHYGWEMVLVAAELLRANSPLLIHGSTFFTANYELHCEQALKAWQWNPKQLQNALEDIRRESIETDLRNWLNLHKPFPGVIERLKKLEAEGLKLVVLSTKGADFTAELLNHFELQPKFLFGHESGTKTELLLQLKREHVIRGFVEDRLTTLEKVLKTPGLKQTPCYLASWGYLKPSDKKNLALGIHLLEPKTLSSPLARWH